MKEPGLAESFAERVRSCGPQPAIKFGSVEWSYEVLDQQASELASRLRGNGLKQGGRIAICLERSLSFVVAALAVVKAGGVYVPLDVAMPPNRLSAILSDCQALMVVTTTDRRSAFESMVASVVIVGEDGSREASELKSGEPPTPNTGGVDDLACVIYTSGSTGLPKGVAIRQRGIMRLLAERRLFNLDGGARMGFASHVAFDASIAEIWVALLSGTCLVGIPPDVLLSADRLAAGLERERIGTLLIPAPLFHEIVRRRPGVFRTVASLLVGGDVLDPRCVRSCLDAGRPGRLYNVYGPTEATVMTSVFEVESVEEDRPLPIGWPVHGTEVFVLDERLTPVRQGEEGELYIGGSGVAAGYIGAHDSDRAFISSPFSSSGDTRLYRTGDLVRQRGDGCLEFVGRVDDQLKVRGFRVDPREVESVLRRHPAVRETLVLGRVDAAGERRVDAYVVPVHLGPTADLVRELRAFLRDNLPRYMIPQSISLLDALPLSRTGKVDRSALPAPNGVEREPRPGVIPPLSEVERQVAEVWAEVLGVSSIGRHDSFLALGGDSLAAVQVLARIRADFGVELTWSQMIDDRATVAAVAATIAQANLDCGTKPLVRVVRGDTTPASFPQMLNWISEAAIPNSVMHEHYLLPIVYRLDGPVDRDALENSIEEIVRRHEALRTSVELCDGSVVQRVHPTPAVQVRLEEVEEDRTLSRALVREAARPFDLHRGPLLRASLLRTSGEQAWLLLIAHHSAFDAVSLSIVNRELSILYGAYSRGEPSPLGELRIQMVDFAAWQHERYDIMSSRPDVTRALDYWRTKLGGMKAIHLAVDHDRVDPSLCSGLVRRWVPASTHRKLIELAAQCDTTMFVLGLSAYKVVLAGRVAELDLCVTSTSSNRDYVELESVAGYMIEPMFLRTDLSGATTFLDVIQRVRETVIGALDHRGVPLLKQIEVVPGFYEATATAQRIIFEVEPALSHLQMDGIAVRYALAETEQVLRGAVRMPADLVLTMFVHEDALGVHLMYNREFWRDDTMEQFIDDYVQHLVAMAEGTRCLISDPAASVGAG